MNHIDIQLTNILSNLRYQYCTQPQEAIEYINSDAIGQIKVLFGIKEDLKPLEERLSDFKNECYRYGDRYNKHMIDQFIAHWGDVTMRGKHKGLMKFEIAELSGTFSIGGRLATWYRNNQKYSIAGIMQRGINRGR